LISIICYSTGLFDEKSYVVFLKSKFLCELQCHMQSIQVPIQKIEKKIGQVIDRSIARMLFNKYLRQIVLASRYYSSVTNVHNIAWKVIFNYYEATAIHVE